MESSPEQSFFSKLSGNDFDKFTASAKKKTLKKNELVFSEGDDADSIYFIKSGRVSILINMFASQEKICERVSGEFFGEMAFFCNNKRNASVVAEIDTVLYCLDKKSFLDLVNTDRPIASKINIIIAQRNEELLLKESLLSCCGLNDKHFHVSIKGDPSIRETSFTRDKYESVIDKTPPQLIPKLEDLILNRCTYKFYFGLNNGEVRTSSIFDPINEHVHQADKFSDDSYVNRHFPLVPFEEKAWMLKRFFTFIEGDPVFRDLPKQFSKVYSEHYKNWEPCNPEELSRNISQLPKLRDIEDFYLRNFSISMALNAIRVQFNCDGTHFVSSEDYEQMLEENY